MLEFPSAGNLVQTAVDNVQCDRSHVNVELSVFASHITFGQRDRFTMSTRHRRRGFGRSARRTGTGFG